MKKFWSVCASVAIIIAAVLFLHATLDWAIATKCENIGVGASTYAAVLWLQVIAVTVFATFCLTLSSG